MIEEVAHSQSLQDEHAWQICSFLGSRCARTRAQERSRPHTRHKRCVITQHGPTQPHSMPHCSYMLLLKHLPLRKARYHHAERQHLLVITGHFVTDSKKMSSGDHYKNDPVQVQSQTDFTHVKHERLAAASALTLAMSWTPARTPAPPGIHARAEFARARRPRVREIPRAGGSARGEAGARRG